MGRKNRKKRNKIIFDNFVSCVLITIWRLLLTKQTIALFSFVLFEMQYGLCKLKLYFFF
jgi:hypothetical protein